MDDLTVCPDGFLLQGNTLLIPCGQNTTLTPSFRAARFMCGTGHLGYTIYGLGPDFLETKLPAIGLGCPSETADCRNLREANRGHRSHRVATARFRVPNRVR